MNRFKGVVAATISPFTSRGEFNEDAFAAIMKANIDAGVDGFWISGGTGESVLLTEEEVTRTAQISGELCRGKAAAMVHVGTLTTSASARMANAAAGAGAAAICCVPPFFYKPTEKAIIDHYRVVADAAGDLPFMVYNQPKYTGVEFSPDMLERIMKEVPQIAGVKHSAPDFSNNFKFAQLGLDVFTGHGNLFLPALAAGAAGVVDGPLTVAPEIWVGIYKAYQSGDLAQADKLQVKANALVALAGSYGMQAACKVLCSVKYGVDCGDTRMPLPSLTKTQKKEIIGKAEALGIFQSKAVV